MTEKKGNPKRNFSYQVIFFGLTVGILFYDSILVLIKGLKRGIFKKEVLSRKSKLGFDFKIILK